ncbi:DUF3857 domain-containing protein [Seonamhaeicola sp. MEBiC1930]|uniref:DUF3857 domain-containing protein n=1 Tax=Seonamhaeicola sp. MEBiC01930 TaxID=2976768 RepID=UPI003246DB21
MNKITLTLLLLPTFYLFSQTSFNSEDFRVTLADINTNVYEKDSTANSVIIYEHGKSWVSPSTYKLMTKEKRKIKILNKEGFDKATIELYMYKSGSKFEKVEDILATTYNLVDGNVITTQLNKKDVYKEKYNENFDIVKFTLPNVKEGTVISYSYTIISPFMFKYKGWEFQHDVPTLFSEYQTSIPANWTYNIKLVGGKKLVTNTADVKKNCLEGPRGAIAHCLESVYAMKNIPAFIEEDYMTTEDNYLSRVEYELQTFQGFDGSYQHFTKTWENVDKELKTDPNVGKQLLKSVNLEELLPNNIISSSNSIENAQAIFEHVQKTYTWNENFRIYKDVSIKDLIKNKSGNVSSINILLHNILKEKGYNVKPLLISTRQHGHPTKIYPVLSDFNYLVAHAIINGETYLLDATDKFLSFGQIPFRCLNSYGRLLDFNTSSDWFDIVPKKSDVFYEAKLHIDEQENIVGTIKSKRTGYHAYNYRKAYFKNKSAYIERLENNSQDIIISDFEVGNSTAISPDFKEKYDIEYTNEETGDNIYLNPFFVKFFSENPFKLQERTYPIDFGYPDSYYYTLKLDIGDNYEIIEKPKIAIGSLPDKAGKLFFSSKMIGNELIVSLKIDFKKAVYIADYYPYLKKFMNKIVEVQNNSLVLLKKK